VTCLQKETEAAPTRWSRRYPGRRDGLQ